MSRRVTAEQVAAFRRHLREDEREPATIRKYLHNVADFAAWLAGEPVCKECVIQWKDHLQRSGQQPVTVNGKLSALNRFFAFLGWSDCRVKHLRIQRRMFRSTARDLTREDYTRLVETAQTLGKDRLALLIETICATGIRVSELRYITVGAAKRGAAELRLKGKIRTILLPGKLRRKLLKYAQAQKIASGEIFLTKSGNSLSRRQIWREMKQLCARAGVEPSKVFPHNLRHLFATAFYRASRDIVKLAGVLGHSSIDTTRLYLLTTGAEHVRQLERLRLVN